MSPGIQSGDLVICRTVDPSAVSAGDIIAFYDPAGNGSTVVTHRVDEVLTDGGLAFRTKGDANNAADSMTVPAESVVGLYQGRIAGAGNVALFMQTSTGLIVCVVMPLLLLVGYDLIRRRMVERAQQKDRAALLAELEQLRRENAEQNHT
jgi:signal peptidase